MLQLPSCKARTIPPKNHHPEDPSAAGWQLSNQDPQIPTHCFCSPSLLSSPPCFQMGFPSKATSGKLSSICSQASFPAASSIADQLISLDYLSRGFLAFLSPPTAMMCIYQTITKRKYESSGLAGNAKMCFLVISGAERLNPLLVSQHIISGTLLYMHKVLYQKRTS